MRDGHKRYVKIPLLDKLDLGKCDSGKVGLWLNETLVKLYRFKDFFNNYL